MKLGKKEMRQRRHERSRFYLSGTAQKPRLAVFRSLKHIYAQVIDDETGQTIVMASSLDKDIRSNVTGGNKNGAKSIGQKLAERAIAKGVSAVVFDKGGYKYHGRVKELAEGARAAGLKF
ncbi:MAG: 50S ribosomal protein L18 [Candidatus Riflebacteria bacterium GWC2_50_8]|nr:ribosomal protein L18 [uncultured bacterium]OGK06654.1 MAG: 50S ribosomal protein L18 [Candidatus Riflebacteria bacterium GWC2_50_8]